MNKVEATKLKEAFDQDGVVVIRNLITQQQLDEICEKAEMLTRKLPKRSGKFSNVIKGLDRMDVYFNDLLCKGPQVAILEMLLGKKPEPTTASIFTKDKHSQEVHPVTKLGRHCRRPLCESDPGLSRGLDRNY